MNTLFLYCEEEAARRTAVMTGSMLSMSRYKDCREDISLRQYGRILLVLTEDQDIRLLTEAVQSAGAETVLGVIVIGRHEDAARQVAQQAETLLGRPAKAVFVPADDLIEGAIAAAEALQNQETAVPAGDEAAWQALEEFLTSHTTGVLATGQGRDIRTTPIEYVYWNKKLYLFSEGGRKFVNLYRSSCVSFSVFEPFSGFQKLAGLQLSGTARMLEPGDEAYAAAAAVRGISEERLQNMPVILHGIEISPSEAVFLWGPFAKMGKAVRQVYRF